MRELRQVISDINLLEARNNQILERSGLTHQYEANKARLEELYRRKSQLMATANQSELQYQL